MFEEELKNLTEEERYEVLNYLDEYMGSVSIGNGDYQIDSNEEIITD